jgi:DNA-binding MarR family transcriptional regulator
MASSGHTDVRSESIEAAEAWDLLVGLFMSGRERFIEAADAEDLSPPLAFTLLRLSRDDPPALNDIARLMRCDASWVTSLADRLEERGLAERRASPEDRRVKLLATTEAGEQAQARLRAAFRTPPPALAALPERDAAALLRIARKLVAGCDDEPFEMLGIPLPGRPGRPG